MEHCRWTFTIFNLIEGVGVTVIIKMLQIQILKYKKICCLISINVLLRQKIGFCFERNYVLILFLFLRRLEMCSLPVVYHRCQI